MIPQRLLETKPASCTATLTPDRCAVSVDGPPKESLSDQTRSGDVATGPSAVFCPLWPARRRRSHPARTATQVAARSAKIRCASPPTALSPRMIAATMATAMATPNHVDVRLSRAHCGDLRKHLATTKGATAATSSKIPRIEWTVACHDLTVSSTVHPSATRQSKRKAGETKFPTPRGRTSSVVAKVRPRVPTRAGRNPTTGAHLRLPIVRKPDPNRATPATTSAVRTPLRLLTTRQSRPAGLT